MRTSRPGGGGICCFQDTVDSMCDAAIDWSICSFVWLVAWLVGSAGSLMSLRLCIADSIFLPSWGHRNGNVQLTICVLHLARGLMTTLQGNEIDTPRGN
jgi:hypothetical protein